MRTTLSTILAGSLLLAATAALADPSLPQTGAGPDGAKSPPGAEMPAAANETPPAETPSDKAEAPHVGGQPEHKTAPATPQ